MKWSLSFAATNWKINFRNVSATPTKYQITAVHSTPIRFQDMSLLIIWRIWAHWKLYFFNFGDLRHNIFFKRTPLPTYLPPRMKWTKVSRKINLLWLRNISWTPHWMPGPLAVMCSHGMECNAQRPPYEKIKILLPLFYFFLNNLRWSISEINQ